MDTSSEAQILTFPLKRSREMQIDLSNIPPSSSPLEVEWPVTPPPYPQKKPQEKQQEQLKNLAQDALTERTLKQDPLLPSFVVKMRRLSSLSERIEHVRKMSLEMAYYLQEIESHSSRRS